MLFVDLGYYRGCCCCGDYCGDHYGGCCGGCCRDCCGDCWWVRVLFIDLACCAGCPGIVGVRGDILVLELNGVKKSLVGCRNSLASYK
jgi:hypothetical protein